MNAKQVVWGFLFCFGAFELFGAELLLDGGFKLPPPGFKVDNFKQVGHWAVKQDMLCSFAGGDAMAATNKIPFYSGSIEVSIAFESGGGKAGLIFNVSNDGDGVGDFIGYELLFPSDFSSVSFLEHAEKTQNIISMPISGGSEKWKKLHVMISKAEGLTVYFDDDEIIRLPHIRPMEGMKTGFISYGAAACFRNFYIRPSAEGASVGALRPMIFTGRETPDIAAKWRGYPAAKNASYYYSDESGFKDSTSQELSVKHGSAGIINRKILKLSGGEILSGSLAIKGKTFEGKIFVRLVNADASKIYAQTELKIIESGWTIAEFELIPNIDAADARFAIFIEGNGSVFVDDAALER